jgi:histone-arginine methyltransferase CARM1
MVEATNPDTNILSGEADGDQ